VVLGQLGDQFLFRFVRRKLADQFALGSFVAKLLQIRLHIVHRGASNGCAISRKDGKNMQREPCSGSENRGRARDKAARLRVKINLGRRRGGSGALHDNGAGDPARGWLNGQTIGDKVVAVEFLQSRITDRTPILAEGAGFRDELQPTETRSAMPARHIALFHVLTPRQIPADSLPQVATRNYVHGPRTTGAKKIPLRVVAGAGEQPR
jgi:hypothetical protein